ncbi:hypothetical protein [Streptomyces odonnellii]|uniref:hypothetical protein n=1 Tax=Streptomyces odonnellii TaxID=1417980 RepID=UPI0012FEACDA|nr:hypothetical protein [Streptomyces odonnellii]
MNTEHELVNLSRTQISTAEAEGGVAKVIVTCAAGAVAQETRDRVVEALTAVLQNSALGADDTQEWQETLPTWLLDRFTSPKTPEQANEWLATWRRLPPAERKQFELDSWDLNSWINWFTEEDRAWRWVGSRVDSKTSFTVFLAAEGWPFAWQALEWLIIQAGGMPELVG